MTGKNLQGMDKEVLQRQLQTLGLPPDLKVNSQFSLILKLGEEEFTTQVSWEVALWCGIYQARMWPMLPKENHRRLRQHRRKDEGTANHLVENLRRKDRK
jgi:hypothetical protein